MQVILAGYNIDATIIDRAKKGEKVSELPLTPETVSVAYARISRDPSPVTELREKSINDVEAARRSARNIVFEMNHQSVAEHATFNFDILDISRLAVEYLEWHRLCSFTEKSQRYQELDGSYVMPSEFAAHPEASALFDKTMRAQFELYEKAHGRLLAYFKDRHPEMLEKRWQRRILEGWAKEDARYAVGLATKAQLGFTANARNLEYLIRKLRASPLAEVRQLADHFFCQAAAVAPSLILLTDPGEYEKEFGRPLVEDWFTKTRPELAAYAAGLGRGRAGERELPSAGNVRLISHSPEPDRALLTSLLMSHTGRSAADCIATAEELLADGGAEEFVRRSLKYANPWEAATREFEAVDFTFEVVLSSACYGQMKRHRMSTQLVQPYGTGLGYTCPPSVAAIGMKPEFDENVRQTNETFEELAKYDPAAAQYIMTNGHRRRMMMKANARELYHVSRLREDAHAQWDIRNLTQDMMALAKAKAPLTLKLAFGKDRFAEEKEKWFS